jgi:hypothetical protein
MDGSARDRAEPDGPVGAPVERVAGSTRAAIFDQSPREAVEPPSDPGSRTRAGSSTPAGAPASGDRANETVVIGAAVVGVLTGLAVAMAVDWRIGPLAGGAIAAARVLRAIDRRVSFSFGEGFISFRREMGWPTGVQEDDDLHWDWNAKAKDA